MATVTSPLMSMDASGQIGHAVVYSKWKGRNYVRRYAKPSNPNTPAQSGVRKLFAYLVSRFLGLSDTAQADWKAAGQAMAMTGTNFYIQQNSRRFNNGAAPVNSTAAINAAQPDAVHNNISELAAARAGAIANLTWTVDNAFPATAGYAVFLAPDMGEEVAGVYALVQVVPAGTNAFTLQGLDPTLIYHCKVKSLFLDGAMVDGAAAVELGV